MQAKDLFHQAPRRWSDTLDGIRWLPRLIDKARAAAAGSLGDYLYGQSPVDRGLLHALALSHRAFAQIVAAAPDDAAVLATLKGGSSDDLAAARAWSDAFPRTHRVLSWVFDVDDGYLGGPWKLLKLPTNVASWVVANGAKKLWPSRAAQGLQAAGAAAENGKRP